MRLLEMFESDGDDVADSDSDEDFIVDMQVVRGGEGKDADDEPTAGDSGDLGDCEEVPRKI